MTQKLYILQGLPASGKSTFAVSMGYASGDKGASIIVSSDVIRFSMIPKGMYHESEVGDKGYSALVNSAVWKTVKERIRYYLKNEFIVIFDATNLRREFWEEYVDIVWKLNSRTLCYACSGCPVCRSRIQIVGVEINTDLQTCIERDSKRKREVGEDIIRKMEANRQHLSEFPKDFDTIVKVNYT